MACNEIEKPDYCLNCGPDAPVVRVIYPYVDKMDGIRRGDIKRILGDYCERCGMEEVFYPTSPDDMAILGEIEKMNASQS